MELKDIVLKKGDIVYFEDRDMVKVSNWFIGQSIKNVEQLCDCKITRIQRQKYETIYKAPKEILDKEEKEWLENFLRPFKDRVVYIKKGKRNSSEFILIVIRNYFTDEIDYAICLPYFKRGTMYKCMELDKKYTLEELGLFKE